jgi:N-methylhydantoinase B
MSPRIFQLRLDGLSQTMQEQLLRTAVSPVVREGADCASAVFTADGELLAMSEAIPLLLGALPGLVRAVLATHTAQTWCEGDIFTTNDPFAGGTHLPDIAIMMPVFVGGQLVAISASLLHHQDIGGTRAGSVPPDATEIYQEGLRIPAMRAGQANALTQDFRALIHAASRVPDIVLGDFDAQVAAGLNMARGIERIISELGVAEFLALAKDILDLGERMMVQRLARFPVQMAKGADGLDPVSGLGACDVCVSLLVKDATLYADFTGSSPQVEAPVNCVASGPLSVLLYTMITLLGPDALRNGGILRRLKMTLPDRSVVNASAPAPVNARTNMVRATASAVLQAMAELVPEGAPAANCGMAYVIAFSGRRADHTPFLATEIIAGGAGGGPWADGATGISTDVGNARNMPAEALEDSLPLRVICAERRRGSGGAGRFKGGDGICRTYEALCDGISVSIRGERFVRVPNGAGGGQAPQPGAAHITRANGTLETLAARSAIKLNLGDRLTIESPGGAGFGASDMSKDVASMPCAPLEKS